MICSQCGNDVAAGSAVCPSCGAQLASNVGQPASAPAGARFARSAAPGAAAAPAFNFDLKRLTRNDQIVGGATVVLLISLFLPWFVASDAFITVSVNGLWHGWEYLTLIIALVLLAYLVMRAGFAQLPFSLPLRHEQLLLAGPGINLLLVVIGFLIRPGAGVGWDFGAFVGLIAAAVAAAPFAVPAIRARSGR